MYASKCILAVMYPPAIHGYIASSPWMGKLWFHYDWWLINITKYHAASYLMVVITVYKPTFAVNKPGDWCDFPQFHNGLPAWPNSELPSFRIWTLQEGGETLARNLLVILHYPKSNCHWWLHPMFRKAHIWYCGFWHVYVSKKAWNGWFASVLKK